MYFINEEEVEKEDFHIPVENLAVWRGDGVFEALKIHDYYPFGIDKHIERLKQSCRKQLFENVDFSLIENNILTVKRESIVSNNANKWKTFNVDDSLGIKLTFYGFNDEVIGSAIFGRSSSDWQRSYVRMVDGNEVYMTNENVLNRLQVRPTFWGSKPPPPVSVEPDSL